MRRLFVVAACAAVALLAGCGSSDEEGAAGSGTASPAASVKIDVGTGKPIVVKRNDHPKIAYLWTSGNLFLEANKKGAEQEARKRGIELTTFDSKFDPVRQMQQLQNVMQQKRYDGLIVIPLDGNTMCPVLTKVAPSQNIPVVIHNVPMCDRLTKPEGDALWTPGIVSFTGYTATVDANKAMYQEVSKRRGAGKHVAALLVGPPLIAGSITSIAALKQAKAENLIPNLDVKYTINTDFTTPDGLAKTQTLLQAHPDVDTIMTIYSDITVGAIRAVKAAGRQGEVKVYDQGASEQSLDAIRSGALEMTTAFYPYSYGQHAVDAIADAFHGKSVPHWIGAYTQGSTPGHPLVIDKTNIDTFKPEY